MHWKKLLETTEYADEARCIGSALDSAGIDTVNKLYNATGTVGAKICGVDTVLIVNALLTAIVANNTVQVKEPEPKPKRKSPTKKKPKKKAPVEIEWDKLVED